MKVQEMHYELKLRLNKVDSNQNRNFLIPEIDIALNNAQTLFVKTVSNPRVSQHFGVETTQRNIDDLRPLIVHDKQCTIEDNTIKFEDNYLYFLNGYVYMDKGACSDVKARLYIQRHNDLYEENEFTKSSFEWRTVNGVFVEEGIKLTELQDVTYSNVTISYIRKPRLIYYGSGFNNGNGYKLPGHTDYPSGSTSVDQDCELPESTHDDIVDIAAMIITGDLASPDYQYKMAKVRFNEFK